MAQFYFLGVCSPIFQEKNSNDAFESTKTLAVLKH